MCGISVTPGGNSERINVFFTVPYLGGGGAERVLSRILKSLDRGKFRPSVLLFERKGVFCDDLPGDVPILDCGRYRDGGRWMWFRNFVHHLRRERPNVVVSFLWETNAVAVLAHFLSGRRGRLILSERSTIIGSSEGKLVELIRRAVIRLLYPAADRIVPNSRALARQLVERFGIPAPKVVVIHNPVDIEEIIAQGKVRGHGGTGLVDIPLVLGIGRLSREKGFDILIRAAAETRKSFRLALLGEGPGEKDLRELAERLGIADRVEFAGFQHNPFAWLHNTSVFVLPSRYEGFPNSLLEAMALGVPCVAARCPTGPEEIVTDGSDGLLVPVDDPAALAEAIDRLLEDPALRARLGCAARERVRVYDAPGIVRRFEALLEEVTE